MDLNTVITIYLGIGLAHALIMAVGMAQKYKDIWIYMPSLVLLLLSLVVVAWPAFVLAFLARIGDVVRAFKARIK